MKGPLVETGNIFEWHMRDNIATIEIDFAKCLADR